MTKYADDTPDEAAFPAEISPADDGLRETPEDQDGQDRPHQLRDPRKRYLAKIGKLAKERDRLEAELASRDADTERIVDERIRAYEDERDRQRERRDFFAARPDARDAESELETLRQTFPAMSWQDAYTFHTARHAPEKLLDGRIAAQRRSKALDTPAHAASRLRAEPDFSAMSAREYGRYLDGLIAGGKITL